MTNTELQTTGVSQASALVAEPTTELSQDVFSHLQAQAEMWAVAAKIAEPLSRTDFAGQFKGKPADMTVAIMKGASLGINPEEIGKSIYVVHGAPALYGKTALAIAKANGYRFERVSYTPQEVTVHCYAPNGDQDEVTYTIERATREGLVKGNKAQYESRPEKMLWWKCIGELADQFFPHLLNGMPIKEDYEQSQSPVRATAERVDRPRSGQSALERAKKKPEPVEEKWKTDPVGYAADGIAAAMTAEQIDQVTTWASNQGLKQAEVSQIEEQAAQRGLELGLIVEGDA